MAAEVSPAAVKATRAAFARYAVNSAELAAGLIVTRANPFQGGQEAAQAFLKARELDQAGEAVQIFKLAYELGHKAIGEEVELSDPPAAPRAASATPDYVLARPQIARHILVALLGTDGLAELSTGPASVGMEVGVTAAPEDAPFFMVKIQTGDATPDRYTLKLSASADR